MSEPTASDKQDAASYIEDPPHTIGATLLKLGPGMIIAGSIVGSGELIATTKTGAEAGFWLLWLIIIGCVIKVFAQVEVGRYTVAHSETALKALNDVPGPRWRVNWIIWFWAATMCAVITQQGGIVGGVGQAMTIQFPLTENGHTYNGLQDKWVKTQVELGQLYKKHQQQEAGPGIMSQAGIVTRFLDLRFQAVTPIDEKLTGKKRAKAEEDQAKAAAELEKLINARRQAIGDVDAKQFEDLEAGVIGVKQQIAKLGEPYDDYIWATIIGVATSIMLYVGRYGLIQAMSTLLVGVFTVLTLITLVMLQLNPEWRATGTDLMHGLSFRLPPKNGNATPLLTALAAFGIIGVGSIELITYPYWCLEKGYARSTGPRDNTAAWARRAQGWMRVMRFDAWLSMVVYTFATIAFYLLGAAVLSRTGLNPGGKDLIRTLNEMYVPVFGTWAPGIFLFGAFAVLYSTYFVAAAGNARTVADAMGLFGLTDNSAAARQRWTKIISAAWPMVAVALFCGFGWFLKGQSPVVMVLTAGIGQGILLPMIGVGALWFRYRRCVDALRPGVLWDVALWVSVIGFVIAGVATIYSTFEG